MGIGLGVVLLVIGLILVLDVVPLRKGKAIWKLRGEAKVEGELVAEAELMATIQPRGGSGT